MKGASRTWYDEEDKGPPIGGPPGLLRGYGHPVPSGGEEAAREDLHQLAHVHLGEREERSIDLFEVGRSKGQGRDIKPRKGSSTIVVRMTCFSAQID